MNKSDLKATVDGLWTQISKETKVTPKNYHNYLLKFLKENLTKYFLCYFKAQDMPEDWEEI